MTLQLSALTPTDPAPLWAVVGDVRGWPKVLSTIMSVTPVNPATAEGVGAAYLVRQPKLGAARWTITEWCPGTSFTWVSRRAGVRSIATHTIEPADHGSRLSLTMTWAGPLAGAVRLLYGRMTRRYLQRELDDTLAAAMSTRPGTAGQV